MNASHEPLHENEEDPALLWAEIIRLRAAIAGPPGYKSWQDAAVAERVQRVKAEQRMYSGRYAGTYGGYTVEETTNPTLRKQIT